MIYKKVKMIQEEISAIGIGCWGFGGDWDGCDRLPDGICGVQDMERIYEGMLRRNYSAELIEDLFYRNLKRVIFEQSEQ